MEGHGITFEINPNDIISCEYVECEDVYDIEVEDNHNYFLENNILVHNSGKTESLYIKYLLELFQPYYFRLAYINKEFRNIRDGQYSGFKRVAKNIGLFDRLKFYDGDYRIVNAENGNSLIPKGMDDPEKTKGLDEVTAIWWDEISKSNNVSDFTTLNALLRTPKAKYLQFAISFNPVKEQHWLRRYFFKEENPHELKEIFKNEAYISHSTYIDNEFIDREAYLKTLIQNSNNNPNAYLVDVLGDWGVTSNDSPFFYSYSKEKHYSTSEYKINTKLPLYVSFDFNVNPTTALIAQFDYNSQKCNIFDLYLTTPLTINGLSPLEAACKLIKMKYIDSGMFSSYQLRITGDASGKNGSADRKSSDNYYSTIQTNLGVNKQQILVRKANLIHQTSGKIINRLLRDLPNGFITVNKLKELQDDILLAYSDSDGTLNKAKKEYGLHIVDAFRYLIDVLYAYPLKDIKQIDAKLTGIINKAKSN